VAARLIVALLALSWSAACGAAELGSLFHTPQEREQLDRLRRGEPLEAPVASGETPVPARDPVVTGYVRRSDGRNTVWIDGRPLVTRDDPRAIDPKATRKAPSPPAPLPRADKPAPAASVPDTRPRS
jgi:hypothetical protein